MYWSYNNNNNNNNNSNNHIFKTRHDKQFLTNCSLCQPMFAVLTKFHCSSFLQTLIVWIYFEQLFTCEKSNAILFYLPWWKLYPCHWIFRLSNGPTHCTIFSSSDALFYCACPAVTSQEHVIRLLSCVSIDFGDLGHSIKTILCAKTGFVISL